VALNLYTIRKEKGPGGDFFRAVQKQRPAQYQGVYIASPEGKVLAAQAREPEKRETWARALVEVIEQGVTAYGGVMARKAGVIDLLPDRGIGRRKDGSIVLAVYARLMLLGLDKRGFGEPAIDSVVLTAEDRAQLESPDRKVGDHFEVGFTAVQKLHRVLSPFSDASTMPRANEVTRGSLSGKVVGISGDVAYLNLDGRITGVHTWEFDPNKGKKIHAEVTLAGVGSCDRKTGKLLSLLLLGDGRYRNMPPRADVVKYGTAVEWRLKR
jgi:hypothetical protein